MKSIILASAFAVLAAPSFAAVTPEEAKQLGITLTEFGAIKAGNKEGTIPAYTGGLTKAPEGFKPNSGYWVDPFKNEKPLLRIDAKNVDEHADKLSEGQKMLIKRNPSTYYLDIYPTHRTFSVPDKVLKATVRNATGCKSLKDNQALDAACRGGMPFPLPKSGYEVMWNLITRYVHEQGYSTDHARSWVIDSVGRATMTAEQYTMTEMPYYQTGMSDRDPQMYWRVLSVNRAPARRAGEMSGLIDFLDTSEKPRRAWSYTPGQRRVKLAPEFAYDTPVSNLGGVTLYDELFVFSGKMDRFDFKLVGKKEMYLPYNNYKFYFDCKDEAQFAKNHVLPSCERWELHRVWVVEATLKPGMRHAYSKRTYYIDEDSYGSAMFDAFDQQGKLYRSLFNTFFEAYDINAPFSVKTVTYDFSKGMFAMGGDTSIGGYKVPAAALPDREMNAEAIVARETTR
ncbi:MAG: DUF1329 domain-containing protein [Pseudomonadota bacterium]